MYLSQKKKISNFLFMETLSLNRSILFWSEHWYWVPVLALGVAKHFCWAFSIKSQLASWHWKRAACSDGGNTRQWHTGTFWRHGEDWKGGIGGRGWIGVWFWGKHAIRLCCLILYFLPAWAAWHMPRFCAYSKADADLRRLIGAAEYYPEETPSGSPVSVR